MTLRSELLKDRPPQSGDLVIYRFWHTPLVYVLTIVGGVPQGAFATFEEAIVHAMQCADEHSINVWYTTDDKIFERLRS